MEFKIVMISMVAIFLISCDGDKKQSIKIGDELAEGFITKDTVFDGLIKFYDINSHKLKRQCVYSNGVENGEQINYYKNGKIADKIFYENGKLNGFATVFDSSGNILNKDFFYYDIKVGPSIDFSNNRVSKYWFYSLDGNLLFYLDYDSRLHSKRITDVQPDYFFYKIKDYSELTESGFSSDQEQYFIYTPNPPDYNFRYSMVAIDSSYKTETVLANFDNTRPWSTFSSEDQIKTSQKLAVKLLIYDSIAGGDITMFKILK